MNKTIIKASGKVERFERQKLINSLTRSGAPEDIAGHIAGQIEKKIEPSSTTRYIYKLAHDMLNRYNSALGMRYSIKKAISMLGPSGYPFEKYFARVLDHYGYGVELNVIMKGYCVSHEVDILASKENRHFIIECKYHGNGSKPTDVKVALYVNSRFADIRKACEMQAGHRDAVHEGWLVTNTRCTEDAIVYAECAGIRIISWKYPDRRSLEKMIEDKQLYPVTILSPIKKDILEALFLNNFILAQDIADVDEQTFIKKSGIDKGTAARLKQRADEICVGL